jgi:hypothetical protein
MRLRLTPAQQSALECSGIDEEFADYWSPGERAVWEAWRGTAHLDVAPTTVDLVASTLNDLSNGEDERARLGPAHDRPFARRASASLAALYGRVLRLSR